MGTNRAISARCERLQARLRRDCTKVATTSRTSSTTPTRNTPQKTLLTVPGWLLVLDVTPASTNSTTSTTNSARTFRRLRIIGGGYALCATRCKLVSILATLADVRASRRRTHTAPHGYRRCHERPTAPLHRLPPRPNLRTDRTLEPASAQQPPMDLRPPTRASWAETWAVLIQNSAQASPGHGGLDRH